MKDNDYEVGYKKPPKEHQFKPGHSGNQNGRPKMVKDFKTDLAEELEELIEINEFGKVKITTKQRAYIKKVTASALNGNPNSIRILNQMIASNAKEPQSDGSDELSDDDLDLIKAYIESREDND